MTIHSRLSIPRFSGHRIRLFHGISIEKDLNCLKLTLTQNDVEMITAILIKLVAGYQIASNLEKFKAATTSITEPYFKIIPAYHGMATATAPIKGQ